MADPVSRLALASMIESRLNLLPGVSSANTTVYVGEVPGQPPTIPGQSRVKPYVVLLSGDGSPIDEQPLTADNTGSLSWPFQVRCAAGYHADVLALLDGVHALLDGWFPTLAGYQFGPVRQPPGYDAGPVRRLNEIEPQRYFLPCQFVLLAVRN